MYEVPHTTVNNVLGETVVCMVPCVLLFMAV